MNGPASKTAVALIVAMLFCGCAQQRVWSYKAESAVTAAPILNKTVAVPPLVDERENSNSNLAALYLIPLMPYGWQTYETPEGAQAHMTSGLWLFKPTEDIAKAIAEELRNSSMFKDAFFTFRTSEGELAFIGEIKSTRYKGYIYSYGLSAYGPLLWIVGAPAAHVNNQLELKLRLEDAASKQVLWESSYAAEAGGLAWLYWMRPDFEYDTLLKQIMKQALPSLKEKLASMRN